MARKVRVFDTTLRDGEQTPGVAFTVSQKIEIARQLAKLGVDIIEAGMPSASHGEMEAVKRICEDKARRKSKICGLARIVEEDIDACLKCNVDMVHVFTPTSDIQIKYTIKMSKDKIVERSKECIRYVKDHGALCLFSAMDASRTRPDFLIRIYREAERAGADIINIPDTVGIMTPFRMKELVEKVRKEIGVPIDVHCHNDFGMAVANTLAAVEAGADGVQVTVNGLGERAGNADLAETVASLHALYGIETNINMRYLVETSKLVERFSHIRLPPNFPVVGENAFTHESGIHVHGVIRRYETFEPGVLRPDEVGHHRRIVLGKHAGKHGVKKKLEDYGIKVTPQQLKEIVSRVKELGDKGKVVTDADLFAIAEVVVGRLPVESRIIELEEYSVMTGNRVTPTAVVRAKVRGEERMASSTGVGPVDAALKAVQQVIGDPSIQLTSFSIDAVTGGSDALADVRVEVADRSRVVSGRGVSDDIVRASVDAMVSAINRLLWMREKK